jgi:Sec-independent protein secretion pathway component TatC
MSMINSPSTDGVAEQRSSFLSSLVSLFASSGTLVCCALPALLVALGAGAALSSLVSAVPQLVWISEHKVGVFAFAGVMLALAGVMQWQNKSAPCPVDPALRKACLRTRKLSLRVYIASVVLFLIGGWFAFVQPLLM